MEANYHFQVSWDDTNLDDDGLTINCTAFGMTLRTRFDRILRRQNSKCDYCKFELLMKRTTETGHCGDFYFFSTILTTTECQFDILVAGLLALVDNQIAIESDELGHITFLPTLFHDNFEKADKGFILIDSVQRSCAFIGLLDLINLSKCPQVEVSLRNVLSFSNHMLKERLLPLFENTNQTGERNLTDVKYICIDEYFAMTSKSVTVSIIALRTYFFTKIIVSLLLVRRLI